MERIKPTSLFKEVPLKDFLENKKSNLINEAKSIKDKDIDDEKVNEYTSKLTNRYRINYLEIDYENRKCETKSKVNSESKSVVYVEYEFKTKNGSQELLHYGPESEVFYKNIDTKINGNSFNIDIETESETILLDEKSEEEVITKIKEIVSEIKKIEKVINNEIKVFNDSIRNLVRVELKKKQDFITKINSQQKRLNEF